MEAITRQFILPAAPQVAAKAPIVYPWETTSLYNLCLQLYDLAVRTGYTKSLEEFKENFGAYLEEHPTLTDETYYNGQYEVTPLPLMEQILQTRHTIVTENIIINPIPFAETSNAAGGYTVTIG